MNDRVATYSGGMKRRLNLAAGLLHDPDILLLDEPTVGVDPQSRNAIFDNLELLKSRGKALLYTTHYMEEVERLADRIVVMDHGKVIADDTLDGLQSRVAGVGGGACDPRNGVPHADRKEPARLMALIPLLAMVRKDLQLFFSDRRSVIVSFVVPIAIASFFGSIFSGPRNEQRAGADRRRDHRSGRQRDLEGHRRRRAGRQEPEGDDADAKRGARRREARQDRRGGHHPEGLRRRRRAGRSSATARSRRSTCSSIRRAASRWRWCAAS